MADSVRKQIMDRLLIILAAVSGMTTVSESIRHWEEIDKKDFPICFPIDTDETKEPITISDGTNYVIQSALTILITTMVFSKTNVTRSTRMIMLQNIEKAITTDSTLSGLVEIVRPTKVTTDMGMVINYSIFDQEFEFIYSYNHTDGG